MCVAATIDAPSAGMCSRPSKRQANHSRGSGSATATHAWYQGSVV